MAGVQFPAKERDCSFLHSIRTIRRAKQSLYPMGTRVEAGDLSPSRAEVKSGGTVTALSFVLVM